VPGRDTDAPPTHYFKALAAGISLVARTPKLRTLVLLATIAGFYVTVEGLAVPYAHEIGQGTTAAGLLLAASPAGAVAGMWLITLWPPERRMKLLGPLAVLACAPLMVCFLAPGLLPTMVLWAVSGLASAYHLPTSAAFVQAVPDAQRGQAFGVASTALKSSQGVGILLAGLIAEESKPSIALAVLGAAGTVAALVAGAAWNRARRSGTGTTR